MADSSTLITSAATMASSLHRSQTRFVRRDLPRVPYIEHPLRVALRLVRWGVRDAELIAAALLHDVVEDCADELLEVFGSAVTTGPARARWTAWRGLYGRRIANFVADVTNPGALGEEAELTYAEHTAAQAQKSSWALLIKASDLKDNAGPITYQLGHGQDAKMLRRLRKYLPVVTVVADELAALRGTVSTIAAGSDLDQLALDLHALAAEHDIQG